MLARVIQLNANAMASHRVMCGSIPCCMGLLRKGFEKCYE